METKQIFADIIPQNDAVLKIQNLLLVDFLTIREQYYD
jgi:hypothetical protein